MNLWVTRPSVGLLDLERVAQLTNAFINRIATATPPHDIHGAFVRFARTLLREPHDRSVFERMAAKAQISHRFSVLPPSAAPEGVSVDALGVYSRGGFPSTAERMKLFEQHAPALAVQTAAKLDLGPEASRISACDRNLLHRHVCAGHRPRSGRAVRAPPSVERTMVGFMGCYAAINALKLARHIVRSAPQSRVLLVNIELCSLHLQRTNSIEQMLSFLVFGDGCAVSLVSADPTGLAIDRFHAALLPGTRQLITWNIRDCGFEMFLSGRVQGVISRGLESATGAILDGASPEAMDLWAVHPGGRSVLDAVELGLGLEPESLAKSRSVLERFGNMSSATVMFVLQSILDEAKPGERGCAMSFGPGLTAETMLFHKV